ncbi:MAG TPA: sigma-70 family RNA polymerase sigma factor [Actinomycetota bacterium]|jgi:RNA polymerase sigma-70 factor (ECF subfamily)
MRVDEVAIREFLHTSYPRLVAAVALTSGSRPAAEDAVQEALIRAWERSDKGEEIDSLEGWVTTVALNLVRSGLRRIRSERRARARLASPRLGVPPTADRIDVDRALAALPRRQREAAVLRYYLQMSTVDAAGAMRVSEGTVKSSLARARAALADQLGVTDDTASEEEANDRGSP